MSTSSITKIAYIQGVIIVAQLIQVVLEVVSVNIPYAFEGIAAVLSIVVFMKITMLRQKFLNVKNTLDDCAEGALDLRIEDKDGGEIKQVFDSINVILQTSSQYVSDSRAVLQAASREDYSCKMSLDGLGGHFYDGAKALNDAVNLMKQKSSVLHGAADELDQRVTSAASQITHSSLDISQASYAMKSASMEALSQSQRAVGAAGQARENVVGIAAATEELTASIGEINRQTRQAASVASVAVGHTEKADRVIVELTQASNEISSIVELIQDIAEQTNLLALNATIEAARAGDAGKGFAVVAGEVKNLADQTAKATEEIISQTDAIKAQTKDAVVSIGEIRKTINDISDLANSLALAVQEQSSATNEISANMQSATHSTQTAESAVQSIAYSLEETVTRADKVANDVHMMKDLSEELNRELSDFIRNISN